MPTLGTAAPSAPILIGTPTELATLAAGFLERATERADTAVNCGRLARATLTSDAGPMTLAALGAAVPPDEDPNAERTFRNLLRAEAFREENVVAALGQALEPADIRAIRIEYADAKVGIGGWSIVSIHDVAANRTAPIDWRRVPFMDDDAIEDAVLQLVETVAARARPPGGRPPVVALDPRLGGWSRIRELVGRYFAEHGMVIDPSYVLQTVNRGPYSQRRVSGGVSSAFGAWSIEDEPPEPLPLKRDHRQFLEYVAPFTDNYSRRYAVVRPQQPTAGLQGRRTIERAAAIGRLMGQLSTQSVTRNLRVDRLSTKDDVAWRRHALLMSVAHDTLTGIVVPSPESVKRILEHLEQQA
jgi:hypothetical protein